MKPEKIPENPCFSSGPCPKRKGWNIEVLKNSLIGRSHRSAEGKALLKQSIDLTKELLEVPEDYLVGIVPASDTGAFEMAMWSMLGERPIDVFAWESFGKGWLSDIQNELKLKDVNSYTADYGQLPDLSKADPQNDIIFTFNGTTSGVRVPDLNWISDSRKGLTFCDATSAVFAMEIDWPKIDVLTFSWQKVLGGEAAHGMLILSPRAVERLESYTPPWPMPKIFRLTKKGKLIKGIFSGATINTPSMICVEDYLDALKWVKSLGGLKAVIQKSRENLQLISEWVADTEWLDFLCREPSLRSNTSVCLIITDPWFQALPDEEKTAVSKKVVKLVSEAKAGYDFGSYRDAPAGFRLWAGATVEKSDLEALFPWISWAYEEVKKS